jgi:hypothetical protein
MWGAGEGEGKRENMSEQIKTYDSICTRGRSRGFF